MGVRGESRVYSDDYSSPRFWRIHEAPFSRQVVLAFNVSVGKNFLLS